MKGFKFLFSTAIITHLLFAGLHAEDNQWIVVTTIQYPTQQLTKLASIPGWHLLVVGDAKTPLDWNLDNCTYLSVEKQLSLDYELPKLLPMNHYSRKNIGYLYAIENGAEVIYDTDDDNEPLGELEPLFLSPSKNLQALQADTGNCMNVYAYFGQPEVWPRGYPLEKICDSSNFTLGDVSPAAIGIEQGLVNLDPDVDAIFRLTKGGEIFFEPHAPAYLPAGTFCPINSQNTFFHPRAFCMLYLPSSVNMRVADIWRGYIAQKMIWDEGLLAAFSGPSAIQERNFHHLLKDFQGETDLYLKAQQLIDFLNDWQRPTNINTSDALQQLTLNLAEKNFILEDEISLVRAWTQDLQKALSRKESRSKGQ